MMKRIVCVQPGIMKEMQAPKPSAKKGEAIVRIRCIGICGTDLHAFRGQQPYFTYPCVLGHELSGEIVEIKGTESGLSIGDPVVIVPYLECGECIACRLGKPNCCVRLNLFGVHIDGGMQEYLAVPVENLMKCDSISLKQAAIVECMSIGAHAVQRSGAVNGEYALVIGAGPIGLSIVKFLEFIGTRTIVMDIDHKRLEFCQKWSKVEHTILPSNGSLQEIKRITNGDNPTVVFDATGNALSMKNAMHYTSHGGRLVFVGLVSDDISFYDPDFHKRELTLISSRNAVRQDFETVIESIEKNRIDTNSFISKTIKFDRISKEFPKLIDSQTDIVKAMIFLP